MAEVTEVSLPGVGVRHEFDTAAGRRVGVLTHRGGRRDLLIFSANDPDASEAVVRLNPDDARTLSELLGASSVSEQATAMERIEGLAIDWIRVELGAVPAAGTSIADLALRTRTGTSIIAVLRDNRTVPAPEPDQVLLPGDTVVVAGTPDGIERARALIGGR